MDATAVNRRLRKRNPGLRIYKAHVGASQCFGSNIVLLYPGQSCVGEGRIFGIDDGLNADIAGLCGKNGADAQGQIVHASVVFAEVRKLVSESRVAVDFERSNRKCPG